MHGAAVGADSRVAAILLRATMRSHASVIAPWRATTGTVCCGAPHVGEWVPPAVILLPHTHAILRSATLNCSRLVKKKSTKKKSDITPNLNPGRHRSQRPCAHSYTSSQSPDLRGNHGAWRCEKPLFTVPIRSRDRYACVAETNSRENPVRMAAGHHACSSPCRAWRGHERDTAPPLTYP